MAPATDFILSALAQEGLDHLFMVPGGLVDPFLPALGRAPQVRAIVAAQEGGAAYMADGYARASGRFGAALCIGGPGLCNMTTAVAAAKPMRRLSWSSVERLQLRWKVSAPFRMRVRQRSTTPPS
jgi:acetolactate synthase I/II/III large subunit